MQPLSYNAVAKRENDFLEALGELDWFDMIEVVTLAHLLLFRQRMRAYIAYALYFTVGLAAGSLVLIPALIR